VFELTILYLPDGTLLVRFSSWLPSPGIIYHVMLVALLIPEMVIVFVLAISPKIAGVKLVNCSVLLTLIGATNCNESENTYS